MGSRGRSPSRHDRSSGSTGAACRGCKFVLFSLSSEGKENNDTGVSLEPRALDRIREQFAPEQRAAVADLLSGYAGPERPRVVWDILELSQGRIEKVEEYLAVARCDYRDILYWAEYYDTDPLLKGRDPKRLVEDILAKWGNQPKPG